MQLNRIIFPSPKPSYDKNNINLIFIPKINKNQPLKKKTYNLKTNKQLNIEIIESKQQDKIINSNSNNNINSNKNDNNNNNIISNKNEDIENSIPGWLEKCGNSDKLLLYFHGNAEDIGISSDFMKIIKSHLHMNVLAIEYPGYGIYEGEKSSEEMLKDSEILYDYLTQDLEIDCENIILLGRSIGSGPATHLATTRKCRAIILMSAYTSIYDIVADLASKFLAWLVKDRFRNIDMISNIRCPILLIHGQKDQLILPKHSQELYNKCLTNPHSQCQLNIRPNMTHNDFNLFTDFIDPITQFLDDFHIYVTDSQSNISNILNSFDKNKDQIYNK